MTSIRGHGRFRCEHSSVAPSIAPLDFSLPSELGDKLFDQPAGPSGTKPPVVNTPVAVTSIPKYSKDDLQRILKTVLKARVPAPTPVLAPASTPAPVPIVAETPYKKLKARFPDVNRGKFYIDCYNFCQQWEDYFATARATGLIRILFATSFLQDRISFR